MDIERVVKVAGHNAVLANEYLYDAFNIDAILVWFYRKTFKHVIGSRLKMLDVEKKDDIHQENASLYNEYQDLMLKEASYNSVTSPVPRYSNSSFCLLFFSFIFQILD